MVRASKSGRGQLVMWLRLFFRYVRPATLLPVFDLLLVNLAVLFALWVWALRGHQAFGLDSVLAQAHWFAILSILWLLLAVVQGFYRSEGRKEPVTTLLSLFWITVLSVLLYMAVYFFAPDGLLPRGIVLYFAAASFILISLWRLVYIAVVAGSVGDRLRLAMAHPQVAAGAGLRSGGEEGHTAADVRPGHLSQSLNGQVLTVQEVAEFLKVSQTTVWRWCQSGKLPAFRVGQQWRIHGRELEERIEELMGSKQVGKIIGTKQE
jgi:excisionase family DNA binding protein